MSNANDETLLEDEDGEDEYDLGNEEEEALLADDCDADQDLHHGNISYMKKSGGRKSIIYSDNKIYRESEEPLEDDVLDLDDLDDDLENADYGEEVDYSEAQDDLDQEGQHEGELQYNEEDMGKSVPITSDVDDSNNNNSALPDDRRNQEGTPVGEVEEHVQHSVEEEIHRSGQKESEDEEEDDDKQDGEGRGRFKSERTTMISLKGNKSFGNIPDTLDGLITVEDKQEGSGRWKRSGGRGGYSRGGFRGNQRGYGSNFTPRRKQQQSQNRQNNQNVVFPHQRVEGSSESLNSLIPSSFVPSSHKIHINPHFRGNVQPQPEAQLWNENSIGNLPPPNSGGQPTQFHDAPRFPPPSMGFGNVDHRNIQPNIMDHHRQQRQRTPPPQIPFHSSSGDRGYDSSPGHIDYHRDQYDSHGPPISEAWMNHPQRMQESSISHQGGHHHQFGGSHQHFSNNMHNERGGGEVLQHFRPTMEPGPLFSHVTSVVPPTIPQQSLMMQQQQHLQNILRAAPPLHSAGIGQMLQIPPQEPHNRIPPAGFSPNDGRPVPSLHHGPPSPWQDQSVNRSPMAGQHMSIVQQQQQQLQQHPGFHQGGSRSFPVERGGNLQGVPLHHIPHTAASMSAPPPPFHASSMAQGPPPHPLHQPHPHQGPLRQNSYNQQSIGSGGNSGPSGSHNNGRFQRQGSGNFQSSGFNRNPLPSQQGPRPNRGAGHMGPNRGGMGPRRGLLPNIRPLQSQKQTDEGFPPKRPSLEGPPPALKPSPPKKRKMRKIMKSNLHEVETVDTLPDTTTINEKETQGAKESGSNTVTAPSNQPEDAALLEYQRKIEQQKQMREIVLQQKEQRRKLMALQKQKELQEKAGLPGELSNDVPKGNAIATIVNRNPVEPSPTTSCVTVKKEPVPIPPFVQPAAPNIEMPQPQLMAARKKALLALKNARGQNISPAQQFNRGITIRGISPRGVANQPIRPQNPSPMGSTPGGPGITQQGQLFKVVQIKNEQGHLIKKRVPIRPGMVGRGNIGGRGQVMEVNSPQIRPMGQGRGNIIGNKGQQVQVTSVGHRLVQVLSTPQQSHPQNQDNKNMLLQRVVKQNVPVASQQQQQSRKVVVQNMSGGESGIEGSGPGTVVVENMSASTSEADLRKMCQTVGRVVSVRMVPSCRSALIEFTHPSSAATFCQRYQRKIVDLSMISVRLANS